MAKSLYLKVWTPEETVLDEEKVAWVQVQLVDGGGIGIRPGHAPLLAETVAAPVRYADDSGEHALDMERGILHIDGQGVTLFTSVTGQRSGVATTSEIPAGNFERLAQVLNAKAEKSLAHARVDVDDEAE
jgi:F-type H+-transporting ATPase subunit epsilon